MSWEWWMRSRQSWRLAIAHQTLPVACSTTVGKKRGKTTSEIQYVPNMDILRFCYFVPLLPSLLLKIRVIVFVGMSRKPKIILDNGKDSSFQRKYTMDTFQACTFAILCKDQHPPVESFTKCSSLTAARFSAIYFL